MIPEVQCKILRKNEAKLVKKEFGRAIVCRCMARLCWVVRGTKGSIIYLGGIYNILLLMYFLRKLGLPEIRMNNFPWSRSSGKEKMISAKGRNQRKLWEEFQLELKKKGRVVLDSIVIGFPQPCPFLYVVTK